MARGCATLAAPTALLLTKRSRHQSKRVWWLRSIAALALDVRVCCAECFKLECDSLAPGTIGQVVYVLQIESGHRVLLLFEHLDKTHNQRLQPIGREDAC
jgi:hypothetical protein